MLLALSVVAGLGADLSIPTTFRGTWDMAGSCENTDSDTRLIVREGEAVFVETIFTPNRVFTHTSNVWGAAGEFNEGGMIGRGSLTLHLSDAGRQISFRNQDNRVLSLSRCTPK
jgi:hypothetical protein